MIQSTELNTQSGTAGAAKILEAIPLQRAKGYGIFVATTVATAAAKAFETGTAGVSTFTFDTKANTDSGDYVVVYDTAGLAWAAAADLTGDDEEPTGPVWAGIPAGRKVLVDISAATTAANVAAAFETALNGLADVPFVAADSTADLAVTQSVIGATEAASVYSADDSADGTVSVVATTPGVDNEFSIDDNTITIVGHGYATGLKAALTTSDTDLPGGLSATDYWVINVDDDTIKLATSAANALAGTAVNITDSGTGTHTLTPAALTGGSYKLQASMDDVTWFDLSITNNVTVTANFIHEKVDPMFNFVRLVWAVTTGQIGYVVQTLVKGE